MDVINPSLSVFYCTDKLSETSPAARRILSYERRVMERADLVFASSDRLVDYCATYNLETRIFPVGVSLEKFERAWRGESTTPADVARLPRPMIGLVGGLRSCVDQALLRELSLRLPAHFDRACRARADADDRASQPRKRPPAGSEAARMHPRLHRRLRGR
jgi:hypothetical protein